MRNLTDSLRFVLVSPKIWFDFGLFLSTPTDQVSCQKTWEKTQGRHRSFPSQNLVFIVTVTYDLLNYVVSCPSSFESWTSQGVPHLIILLREVMYLELVPTSACVCGGL